MGETQVEQLSPETQRHLDWYLRNVEWLASRIRGGREDAEQFVAMYEASVTEAKNEGLDEAARLLEGINKGADDPVLRLAVKWVRQLAALNRKTTCCSPLGDLIGNG